MYNHNYYNLLGVARTASIKEIKRAYRALALQHHPDLHPNDITAEMTLKAINVAAAVLLDPVKRVWYDRYGQGWQHYQSRAAPATAHYTTPTTARDGYDVEYTATITLAEARVGTNCTLQFYMSSGQPYVIEVPIPAGVISGSRVRVKGAGGPGLNSWHRGDLYLVIKVQL